MTEVKFYDPVLIPGGKLVYSVITARFKGKWMLVRHIDRNTWEIPGGHIEDDETPEEAASRELKEETGATEFNLACIATYSVTKDGKTGFGRLFFAEVFRIGEIPDISEIAECKLMNGLAQKLTYPDIQPVLFKEVKRFLKEKGNI